MPNLIYRLGMGAMPRRAASDELDDLIAERARRNPAFPAMVDDALRTRELVRKLADRRRKSGLSQTLVAARMGTSQSAVTRLESGDADVRLSTLNRYAVAIGQRVSWSLKNR